MDPRLLAAAAALSAGALVLSFTVTFEDPGWEKQVLDQEAVGFVDVEVQDGVHAVARTGEGLEYFHRPEGMVPGNEGEFLSETVSGADHAGSYASLEIIRGRPSVAFQVADTGREKLRYATRNGNWTVETVDNARQRGLNVGMYAELVERSGEPVIFYHSDLEEPLLKAEKRDREWNTEVLERDAGFFTDAEACGDTVKAAFGNRSSGQLMLGELSGGWSSRELDARTTSIDLELEGCEPGVLFHSRDGRVKYWNGSFSELHRSRRSRVSLAVGDRRYVMFSDRDARKLYTGTPGNLTVLESGEDAGAYNDLEARGGNRYALYTNGSQLVYAEYAASEVENRRALVQVVQGAAALGLLATAAAYWRMFT